MEMYIYVSVREDMNVCICKKANLTSTETFSGAELGRLLGSFFESSVTVGTFVLLSFKSFSKSFISIDIELTSLFLGRPRLHYCIRIK